MPGNKHSRAVGSRDQCRRPYPTHIPDHPKGHIPKSSSIDFGSWEAHALRDQVREFLLVPYFGACIHVPPPPANQIVHVVVAKTVKNVKLMAAVWVSGTIHTVRAETRMGSSAYEMSANLIEPYKLEEWSPIWVRHLNV